MTHLFPLLLSLAVTGAAQAQVSEETQAAATNMWVATSICLSHADRQAEMEPAFAAAGFAVTRVGNGLDFDIQSFGVTGEIRPLAPFGFCALATPHVALNDLQPTIFAAAQAAYPAGVPHPPRRVYRAGCHTMDVDTGTTIQRLEFTDAIGGSVCADTPTSALIFQ